MREKAASISRRSAYFRDPDQTRTENRLKGLLKALDFLSTTMASSSSMENEDRDDIIEHLKAEAAAAAGGRMIVHESAGMDPSVREQFWRHVIEFETAGTTDLLKELKAVAVEVPDPDSLNDEALHSALWTTIEALGKMHVYLDQTDHLSDRELYTLLWSELLPEEMTALDPDEGSAWHIDILGGCSEQDTALYLKHYADEATRQVWRTDFPDFELPDHLDPPYDRDRHLPPYQETPTGSVEGE